VEEQTTRAIKNLAPKPSDAIKAMIAGLREIPSEDFQLNMMTFGRVEERASRKICCGCAATCAVHKLAGRQPSVRYIGQSQQSVYLGFEVRDLASFEAAIDQFRCGHPMGLFCYYYGYESVRRAVPTRLVDNQSWYLSTGEWKSQIPRIERYVEELELAGF
jgi:hypothetical protein